MLEGEHGGQAVLTASSAISTLRLENADSTVATPTALRPLPQPETRKRSRMMEFQASALGLGDLRLCGLISRGELIGR